MTKTMITKENFTEANKPNDFQNDKYNRFCDLRKHHQTFTYENYSISRLGNDLKITFNFSLAPNILFTPTTVIKSPDWARIKSIPIEVLNNLAFHLGLIELISYWKTACPQNIIIKAGSLTAEQITWWSDLILNGMKEFFFVNKIDFSRNDLFTIKAPELNTYNSFVYKESLPSHHELVFVSGGKDSLFSLEFLRENNKKFRCLLLNPSKAASTITNLVKCTSPIIVERTIDSKLLELNRCGYLNGHTPFSAYLAFLGVICAIIYGHDNIVTSNERGCEEPVAMYLDTDVIHQYSKTYQFEKKLHDYVKCYLASSVKFFSLLRPLYELQIVKLFSKYPQHFKAFRSCNRKIHENSWCCQCAKCLFIFTSFYPFISSSDITKIFNQNLFEKEDLLPLVEKMVGLKGERPLECIGTRNETIVAFYLSLQKVKNLEYNLPVLLHYFESNILPLYPNIKEMAEKILHGWSNRHNIPKEYTQLLHNNVFST